MFKLEYLRSFRFGPYALFDISLSFLGILLLSPFLTRLFRLLHLDIPLLSWMLLALPIGILTHLLIGKQTLMVQHFLDPTGHYFLKIILLTICVMGIKGIKIIK